MGPMPGKIQMSGVDIPALINLLILLFVIFFPLILNRGGRRRVNPARTPMTGGGRARGRRARRPTIPEVGSRSMTPFPRVSGCADIPASATCCLRASAGRRESLIAGRCPSRVRAGARTASDGSPPLDVGEPAGDPPAPARRDHRDRRRRHHHDHLHGQ